MSLAEKMRLGRDTNKRGNTSGRGVYVPQKQLVVVTHELREQFDWIATDGLATCVGLLVIGGGGVALAHLDEDCTSFSRRIAAYVIGLISPVTAVHIVTNSNEPTTHELINQLIGDFGVVAHGLQAKPGETLAYNLRTARGPFLSADTLDRTPAQGVPYRWANSRELPPVNQDTRLW